VTTLMDGVSGAMTAGDAAISARGLRKSFAEKTVLDGIDLTVRLGTIQALLGPSGAGKTTAVHLPSSRRRRDPHQWCKWGETVRRAFLCGAGSRVGAWVGGAGADAGSTGERRSPHCAGQAVPRACSGRS
jgi:hypothetical protein